jgi:uncharacterized protein with HEPN domain
MNNRDRDLLLDIIDELNYIKSKVLVWKREEFLEDIDAQHIAGMALINIGEICNAFSDGFIEEYNKIPIFSIVGMRDIAAHGYKNALDMNIVWNTLVNDIPVLLEEFKKI